MKHKILCVDDEPDILQALERMLRKDYQVITASSGQEGLEILKTEKVALIISDQRMPEMTGVEFLKNSMAIQPEPIRILLTGYTDVESIVHAVNQGQIYRYLTKPWDSVDLINTISKAIETYNLTEEIKIKNIELEKAFNELKGLDQAKNHFMYLVNHELKTPLTVITSFLALLKETELNEEQNLFTKKIDQSNQRLTKIVEDVLELVSAETKVLKLNKAPFYITQVLNAVSSEHTEKAKKKGQEIKVESVDANINADQKLIEKVLHRLIDNAIKFSPKDSPIIVKSELAEENLYISISNAGEALDPKSIQKILQAFSLDEDILHHSGGLGLGLSLCQALLKRHGSHLLFDHQDGHVIIGFKL